LIQAVVIDILGMKFKTQRFLITQEERPSRMEKSFFFKLKQITESISGVNQALKITKALLLGPVAISYLD